MITNYGQVSGLRGSERGWFLRYLASELPCKPDLLVSGISPMLADVAGVLAGDGQTWFVLAECSCPVELYSDIYRSGYF